MSESVNKRDKYKTRISGLDSLLYGGIHFYENDSHSESDSDSQKNEKGLLFLTRGEHGVNKVHLAMQICEGLFISKVGNNKPNILFKNKENHDGINKEIYFYSINKDKNRLRDTYIGFLIQRLINDVRSGIIDENSFKTIFSEFVWEKETIDNNINDITIDNNINDIINNLIFYDDRTHSLCRRNGTDEPEPLFVLNRSETEQKMNVVFKGKKNFDIRDNEDTLAVYERMLDEIVKVPKVGKETFRCIMIDGLSRLSESETEKISFSELTNLLRERCDVGVITADTKIAPTSITADIVIDMVMREEHHPDCIQYALKISKCLYQKHVYGWHSYKMRRSGIEVIPSIHFQMNSRFHMDNAVHDATLVYDQIPIEYWFNEVGEKIDNIQEGKEAYKKIKKGRLFALSVRRDDDGRDLMSKLSYCFSKEHFNVNNNDYYLFIDLSRTRKEFFDNYNEILSEYIKRDNKSKIDPRFSIKKENFHLFNFRPGHIHDDDFLYTIEKQVKAIARKKIYNEFHQGNDTSDTEQPINEKQIEKELNNIHIILGDINYINFAYPCLNRDGLLLPAFLNFTKRYQMNNFIFTTARNELSILEKEKELYQQLKIISHYMMASTNYPS